MGNKSCRTVWLWWCIVHRLVPPCPIVTHTERSRPFNSFIVTPLHNGVPHPIDHPSRPRPRCLHYDARTHLGPGRGPINRHQLIMRSTDRGRLDSPGELHLILSCFWLVLSSTYARLRAPRKRVLHRRDMELYISSHNNERTLTQ